MPQPTTKEADIGIIGGGLSGLFACYLLQKKNAHASFILLNNVSKLGGYASFGGMKIGFLPAGRRTAEVLSHNFYSQTTKEFIDKFIPWFTNNESSNNSEFTSNKFYNKFYPSVILLKPSVYQLINNIKANITGNILFDNIEKLDFKSDKYVIYTLSGNIFRFKKIIIATGRNPDVIKILKNFGVSYSKEVNLLLGCRAVFKPKSAEKYFRHQPDFKIKFNNGFQTYCFNHTGRLVTYRYNTHKFFSGTYKKTSSEGNVFLGKRVNVYYEDALSYFSFNPFTFNGDIRNNRVKKFFTNITYQDELSEAIECLRTDLGFSFKSFHFPALEQFWERPTLKDNSLESSQFNNLYYIGDSSGIAFGVLQCYITARYALEEIWRKHVLP